jgi:hypothetical protein
MQSFEHWFGQARRRASEIPAPTRGLERDWAEFQEYRRERESLERRSMIRGLIVVAALVLVGSIAHAGLDRVFVHGWWRP